MDDVDRRLLAMVAAHEFVTIDHVVEHLVLDAERSGRRLEGLCADRLLCREQLAASLKPLFRVTDAGLAAIGSRLVPPGPGLRDVRHQVAAAMVWVASWAGAFGDPGRVLSRREAEGLDRVAALTAAPGCGFGLQLGGGVVFPDVSLASEHGPRVAVLVLLWPFRFWDLERVLAAYRDQQLVDAVLVLTEGQSMIDEVKATAARVGAGRWVHVRGVITGARTAPAG